MLNWANRFNIFCFLDNNQYSYENPQFECILAAGAVKSVTLSNDTAFADLRSFSESNPGWLFGHFNYPSASANETGFPAGFFFTPETIVRMDNGHVMIESSVASPEEIFTAINAHGADVEKRTGTHVSVRSRFTESQYLDIIASIKKHIQRGDCYELNFCQEFYSTEASADPLYLYHRLTAVSPNPFAAFYKLHDKYCLCASPERFLKKTGPIVCSQPIKGTSKRDLSNAANDLAGKEYLSGSTKEKSENVMVVDLVRNDLSRICTEGSVTVKELFGIYSFPQVHQMISTIQGRVDETVHWTTVIEACFPMGSMTGAPKIKVMELIAQYESYPRGLFSGSIGYVTPEGDFDFNVVIRSLFYNETKKYLSFNAGSGITFYSDPALEYIECMMKASAILRVLEYDQAPFFLPPEDLTG